MFSLKFEKDRISMYLYLFFINLYYSISGTIIFDKFLSILLIPALLFWIFHFFIERKMRISWKYIPIILIVLLNYYKLKDSRLLIIVLSVICAEGIEDYTNVLKFIFIERLFITLSIILFAVTGIIPNQIVSVERGVRYSLGFNHPNQLMICFGILIFLYLCINKNNMNLLKFGMLFLINILCYFISYSRTALLCISFTIILSCIQYYIGIEKILYYLSRCSYPVLMFLSLYIPFQLRLRYIPLIGNYISKDMFSSYQLMLRQLDEALAYRMTLSASYLRIYGLTWIGEDLDLSIIGRTRSYYVLDSGYLNLLYGCGIIGSVIFIILNMWTIKVLLEKKEYSYVVVMIGVALWGFTEDVLYSMKFNFTLLFLGVLLSERKNKHKSSA